MLVEAFGHAAILFVAADCRTGILEPASLVVAGPVYTRDVFAKPTVKNKRLGLEVTVESYEDDALWGDVRSTIVQIRQLNDLESSMIVPGQVLVVPKAPSTDL